MSTMHEPWFTSGRVCCPQGRVVDEEAVRRAAGRLSEQGRIAGSVVLTRARSDHAFVSTALATLTAGAWLILVNPRWGRIEKEACRTRFGALPERAGDTVIVASGRNRLLPGGGIIACTSGSSGQPKWVALALPKIVDAARRYNEAVGMDQDGRWLAVLPLTHVAGFAVLLRSWIAGGTCILHPPVGADALLPLVDTTKPDLLSIVPAQIPKTGIREVPGLQWIVGGDALQKWQRAALAPLGESLWMSYGMTETFGGVAFARGAQTPHRFRLIPGWHKQERAEGELWLSGPVPFAGYLDDGGRLRSREHDAPYKTGDVVSYYGEDSFLLKGRADAQVKVNGFSVDLTEIRHVLESHPLVVSAQVALIKHEGLLRAELSCKNLLSADEIERYCRDRLAGYKVPRIWELGFAEVISS